MIQTMQTPALLIDLDGTIYKGDKCIDGAQEFLQYLNSSGYTYLFVTNRGNRRPDAVAASLISMGLNCDEKDILTSSMATADYLKTGSSAFWIGELGLDEAMQSAGITFNDINPDVVIAGYDREFNYQKLTRATRLIYNGARFLATNDDRVITVEDGLIPEAGPIVAAIQNASGTVPTIIGKPHSAIIKSACKRLKVKSSQCIIVGDNLYTDILTGVNHGLRSALVLTGVTCANDPGLKQIKPTWVVNKLAELNDILDTA